MKTPESFKTNIRMKYCEIFLRELVPDLFLYFSEPRFGLLRLQFAHLGRVVRGIGVDEREREVFEIALHFPHAEAVRDWRVDLERLERDAVPLRLRHVLERLHVVVAVRELHDEHANVARGRDEQAAEALGVTLGTVVLMGAELRHAVDDEKQFLPKFFFDVLTRNAAVLDRVVEESRGDRHRVHAEFGEYLGDRCRMDEIGFARIARVLLVRLLRTLVRLLDKCDVLGAGRRHLTNDFLQGGHKDPLYTKMTNLAYFKYSDACS